MSKSEKINARFMMGILFIVLGLLCLLGELDVINYSSLWRVVFSWKTFLIAFGLLLASTQENRMVGFIMLGVGVLFWTLHIVGVEIDFHQVVLPLGLVFVGLSLVLRQLPSLSDNYKKDKNSDSDKSGDSDYIDVEILDDDPNSNT